MQRFPKTKNILEKLALITQKESNQSFVYNRNPKNLEKLKFAYNNDGFFLEKPGKTFYNKLILEPSGKYVTAKVIHLYDGTVFEASTKEWAIKKHMPKTSNFSAFANLARVFADRCLKFGIHELRCDFERNNSKNIRTFLSTVEENGILLTGGFERLNPNKPKRNEEIGGLEDLVHTNFKNSEISLNYTQNLKRRRKNKQTYAETNTSKVQKKHVNIYLKNNLISWNQALILNQEWLNYAKRLIDLGGHEKEEKSIVDRIRFIIHKIDLHGAFVTVISARNSCLNDIKGIILLESKNTIKILETGGSIKVIPKLYCIFKVQYGEYEIVFYGEQLVMKPLERFFKKIKKNVPPVFVGSV